MTVRIKSNSVSHSVVSFFCGCLTTLMLLQALNFQQIWSGLLASDFSSPRATQSDPSTAATKTQTEHSKSTHHYLEKLLYKYGSDKSHDDHSYSDFYQMILDPIRLNVKNMTEIGVSAGQSVQAWYHYFPNADIHAFDVETLHSMTSIAKQLSDRLHYTETDLQEASLEEVGLHDESMDVIVEDAMHANFQQQTLLKTLFRLVRPGGYYIIEDMNYINEGGRQFHRDPEHLLPEVQTIMQNHDTIFIDAHVGHRAWGEWINRTKRAGTGLDHWQHNSYLLAIRKRHEPRPPVRINLRQVAMFPDMVVLDKNISDPLGENQ